MIRDTIRAMLAIIFVASLTWSAAAQDSPLSPEETQIIEKARELAIEYTANLPILSAPRQSVGLNYQDVHRHGSSWIRLPWIFRLSQAVTVR